jgi:hypothetical protein
MELIFILNKKGTLKHEHFIRILKCLISLLSNKYRAMFYYWGKPLVAIDNPW